jgi:hypothetical protein
MDLQGLWEKGSFGDDWRLDAFYQASEDSQTKGASI